MVSGNMKPNSIQTIPGSFFLNPCPHHITRVMSQVADITNHLFVWTEDEGHMSPQTCTNYTRGQLEFYDSCCRINAVVAIIIIVYYLYWH